jgi:hypothetical protein
MLLNPKPSLFSKRLAEAEPSHPEWQRELGSGYSHVGGGLGILRRQCLEGNGVVVPLKLIIVRSHDCIGRETAWTSFNWPNCCENSQCVRKMNDPKVAKKQLNSDLSTSAVSNVNN